MTATGPGREPADDDVGPVPPVSVADPDADSNLFERVADAVSEFVAAPDTAHAHEVDG